MSALAALTERSLMSAARDGEMIFEVLSPQRIWRGSVWRYTA